jgi:hypothetical protein
MNVDQMRECYIEALMDYIKMEYSENLPETLSDEMVQYFKECFNKMTCYPNAAGRFCELYKTKKEIT